MNDFYRILKQVNSEEIPEGLTFPKSFDGFLSEVRTKHHDVKKFARMLKAMVHTNHRILVLVSFFI